MIRKFLYTAFVAAVMATPNSVYAFWTQPVYEYLYFDNGQIVGQSLDDCSESGVTTYFLWGYVTSDVHVGHVADCVNGWWRPL
ncbi:MAG: hypothetical protein WBR13_12035 [Allosphingosinicella sp.]